MSPPRLCFCLSTGHLIAVDSASLRPGREGAVLVSPVLEQRDWSCVRLVYQITGRGSLEVHLRPHGDNFDYRLWAAGEASDSWLIGSVDLPNASAPYQVGVATRRSCILGLIDCSCVSMTPKQAKANVIVT